MLGIGRMRTRLFLAIVASLAVSSGALAATFWPSSAPGLTQQRLSTLLRSRQASLIEDRLLIDDMMFPRQRLLLSGFSAARWPKGRLVYDASSLDAKGQKATADACGLWAMASPIQCVQRTTEAGGYLKITKVGGSVSSTDVGYPGLGKVSRMNLCCFTNLLHIAHELGHSLGLSHEQARSDRDRYIRIETANIKTGHAAQFAKRNTDNYGTYDFRSVMHYRQDAFSANGKPTIVVLPPNQAMQTVIGRAAQISSIDRQGMTARYAAP